MDPHWMMVRCSEHLETIRQVSADYTFAIAQLREDVEKRKAAGWPFTPEEEESYHDLMTRMEETIERCSEEYEATTAKLAELEAQHGAPLSSRMH